MHRMFLEGFTKILVIFASRQGKSGILGEGMERLHKKQNKTYVTKQIKKTILSLEDLNLLLPLILSHMKRTWPVSLKYYF